MERILVPLDGSPLAEEALPHAKKLASRFSGIIFLVRVIPTAQQLAAASFASASGMQGVPPIDVSSMDKVVELQLEEARAYLTEAARKIQAEGIQAEWEVREGAAAEVIIQCAREKRIDGIVISSHGRSGLGRLVFGSVADRVIRDSGIPVMVIKPTKGRAS
ncbi:MAG: universal stress protein [Dehalococcoidia bacterium]|nr:universal stress protein [Dehalococcoidia bacterium]